MRGWLRWTVLSLVFVGVVVWVVNSAWLHPDPADAEIGLIAHRGVHQPFSREGLNNQTCTAAQSLPAEHQFLENTIPSMRAAFDAGADAVELDIHLTADGKLAVFHDWTLDCRTDGTGRTRDATMSELGQLDVGYGYTADGGRTFPFRGKGVGMLVSLDSVFDAIGEGAFLINVKSNEPADGQALADLLESRPDWRARVWGVYGGPVPVGILADRLPEIRTFHRRQTIDCLMDYLAIGWTSRVPETCRGATLFLPISHAWLMWGWPDRFVARMQDAGSTVVLIGPFQRGDVGTRGLDTAEQLSRVPASFNGLVQTDRIERIGPLLGR